MEHNKAPGSDDFPAEFCQVFWGDQRWPFGYVPWFP
jgi:hypothetical protein